MSAREKEDMIQINLRLPRAVHRRLMEKAKKARRPLNWEMVVRLEASLEGDSDELLKLAEARRDEVRELYNLVAERFGMPKAPPRIYGLLAPDDMVGKPVVEDGTRDWLGNPAKKGRKKK
jgi:hypothetical protein